MCPLCQGSHRLSACPRWRVESRGSVQLGLLAWILSLAAVGWWCYGAGQDREIAAMSREDAAGRRAAEIAADVSARAIAKLEIKHVTIRKDLEREVQTREVYRDCRSGPDAVGMLNATVGAEPTASDAAGGGKLPPAGAAP